MSGWSAPEHDLLIRLALANPEQSYAAYAGELEAAGYALREDENVRRHLRDTIMHGVSLGTERGRVQAAAHVARADAAQSRPDLLQVESDKKVGDYNWREMAEILEALQTISDRASSSQDEARFGYPKATQPVVLLGCADAHWGSLGTDYRRLRWFIDTVKRHPEIRLAGLGDLEHMAIKLRGVLEVLDNGISVKMQHHFTRSLTSELLDLFAFQCWDNHSVERQENAAGNSTFADIVSERVIYFNHIGHLDFVVGQQVYRGAVSHRFRGRSASNPLHGQMTYIKQEAPEREFVMAGDSHVPGMNQFMLGGVLRTCINGGTFQTKSGYARRYFSLRTSPAMPCLEFYPDSHTIVPYFDLTTYLVAKGFAGELPQERAA